MSSQPTSRDASRRLAARGLDLQSEAKLLVERARAGDLDPKALKVAAWVGDPAAALALDAPPPCWDDLGRFAEGLQAVGGVEATRRFGFGAIRELQRVPPQAREGWVHEQRILRNWEAPVICPCQDHGYGYLGASTIYFENPPTSDDMIFPQPIVFLGSDGLVHTLARVHGRRRDHLPEAYARGAAEVAEWFLHDRDPLRSGWATPGSRLSLRAIEEAVRKQRGVDVPTQFLEDSAYEILDPRVASWLVQALWNDPEDLPELTMLEEFHPRSDEEGLWERADAIYEGDRGRFRSALLGEDLGDTGFDFNF